MLKRTVALVIVLCLMLLSGCQDSANAVPDERLQTAYIKQQYLSDIADKEVLNYQFLTGGYVVMPCNATQELLDILRLDEWQETDVSREQCETQWLFEQRVESYDDGSHIYLRVGKTYGGIERRVNEQESINGLESTYEAFDEGVYFILPPQVEENEIFAKLVECGNRYAEEKGW